jgi:DNA invertase Pin-like site-specific DNA recombinase
MGARVGGRSCLLLFACRLNKGPFAGTSLRPYLPTGSIMASIGYARVSTLDQNADLQHTALKTAGCKRIFTDHGVSGTRASRPELDRMLDHLREGDEVVVWKLDRLGRNTRNLLALIDDLEGRGVHFRSLTEGISTTGAMGRAMLTVMSAFAQLERDQLKNGCSRRQ